MFTEAFPIVSTADLTRSLEFYVGLLGATVVYQFPAEGDPGYVGLSLGSSHLGIGLDRRSLPVRGASGCRCGSTPAIATQRSSGCARPARKSWMSPRPNRGVNRWLGCWIRAATRS